ncbi:hypothetical protein GCM10007853_22480 [Algimonas ampicilliniresistens]|uniref:Uncharacterized protein n=1 Tax=Algimonas ampicilliniresistens TaxID=1298735 RepID=A0ABQ5VCF4_9PROT|nr:hypothetical protein [Algimonas ampicilliniresistens]GLQ24374.1 hypothetical protein GCM10007853_22480 [Algimonas ampicilliniresistens]
MEDIFFKISAKDWAEIIRNYVLSGAAVFTSWVAWQGLTSWKHQKVWEENTKLAKELLLKFAELDSAVVDVIVWNPFFENEGTSDLKHKHPMLAETWARFQNLRKVDTVLDEISALSIHAEILWGRDLLNRVRSVERIISEIKTVLYENQDQIEDHLHSNRDPLFTDEYKKSFQGNYFENGGLFQVYKEKKSSAEKYLQEKLGRSS